MDGIAYTMRLEWCRYTKEIFCGSLLAYLFVYFFSIFVQQLLDIIIRKSVFDQLKISRVCSVKAAFISVKNKGTL